MNKKEFDNWSFAKGQTVTYRCGTYELLGVDFDSGEVLIKINDEYRWIDYDEVIITPF